MSHRVQYRRDTKERWEEINPILMEGEVGFETDTHHQKIGDGVHAWNDLEYEIGIGNIAQELGNSGNLAISQKAVTDAITNLNGLLKQEASVRNGQVKNLQANLDAEIAMREVVYLGDLGDFTGVEAVGFVDSLLASITNLGKGLGKYSFNIGGEVAGSKQFVTFARVDNLIKLTIEGCLTAETLNGDGLIDGVTSQFSTVVECDVTKKVWRYVGSVVDDTFYPEMIDEFVVDEEAVQRSNKVMSREQILGIFNLLKSKTVYLSESEYQALAENNQIKEDVEYNIYEDEE